MRYLRGAYAFLALVNVPFFLAIWVLVPRYRNYLVNEDSYMENLSALLYFGSALVFVALLFLLRSRQLWKIYLPLAVIALLGALSELSFGQRIFRFESITLGGRHRIDAAHDFIAVFVTIMQENILLAAVVLGGGGIAALWLAVRYRGALAQLPGFLRSHPPYGYALVALGFMVGATLIDVGLLGKALTVPVVEEVFEMNSGLAMFFAALAVISHMPWRVQVAPAASST